MFLTCSECHMCPLETSLQVIWNEENFPAVLLSVCIVYADLFLLGDSQASLEKNHFRSIVLSGPWLFGDRVRVVFLICVKPQEFEICVESCCKIIIHYSWIKLYCVNKPHFSFFSFLVVLGCELIASHLLGRDFTTWATSPALSALGYFSDRV
jgi:hypothetical protein